jgi:hypothetical protein
MQRSDGEFWRSGWLNLFDWTLEDRVEVNTSCGAIVLALIRGAILQQEQRQSRRHHAILIPVWARIQKCLKRLVQRFGNFDKKTNVAIHIHQTSRIESSVNAQTVRFPQKFATEIHASPIPNFNLHPKQCSVEILYRGSVERFRLVATFCAIAARRSTSRKVKNRC